MKAIAITWTVLAVAFAAGCEKKKIEETAQKVGEAAKAFGETVAEGAKKAWEATKEGAKYVGEKVAEGAKVVAAGAKESWITTKIKTAIGVSKLFSVSVSTEGSKVTLSGTVKTEAEKADAERIAKATEGVTAVENKIEVKP
jgi:osmotically-inducible protein OsmY